MKGLLVVIVAVIAFCTCPGREDHVKAIVNEVKNSLAATEGGAAVMFLGLLAGDKMQADVIEVALVAGSEFKVNNYGVFSVGTAVVDGNARMPVSVGAFGHVFVLNKDK